MAYGGTQGDFLFQNVSLGTVDLYQRFYIVTNML